RRADHPDRSAFGECAEDRMSTGPDADVDAAGEHDLDGLAAALGVEHVEREAMLLEDAGVLAELRHALLPAAALPDRDLERILRDRSAVQEHQGHGGGQTPAQHKSRHLRA